jgi:predicted nuclease with TOPRIM domain
MLKDILKSKVFWIVVIVIIGGVIVVSNYSGLQGQLYNNIDGIIKKRVDMVMSNYEREVKVSNNIIEKLDRNIERLNKQYTVLQTEQSKIKTKLDNMLERVEKMSAVDVVKRYKELGYGSALLCVEGQGGILVCSQRQLYRSDGRGLH